MGGMLDFFKGGTPSGPQRPRNSVSVYTTGSLARPTMQRGLQPSGQLPRAVAIYAAAAAVFAVITVYYLVQGPWWTGLIMILPTFCLGGFAWHYLKVSGANTKPW